ncbi:GGDEF domain-containing protein [Pseudomaricurvus alkylphenolicus]|uniref:diguanylate cyclase n=1 Tax=Pseudomaricurvus alkylphenolicus TaxID=1306991 RepID=UPI0014212CC2|nr:GGDEF domain-containing protein [Pseudomaricurvus alkylphenolicus]
MKFQPGLSIFRVSWFFGLLSILLALPAFAKEPWNVSGHENGEFLSTQMQLWQDDTGKRGVNDAYRAFVRGEFSDMPKSDSTGLKAGALWGHVRLRNTSDEARLLHMEYVDHQLIYLDVYQRPWQLEDRSLAVPFSALANISMLAPFEERPVAHHRFVVPVTLAPGEELELLIRYGSADKGFFFPKLRLWSPENLRQVQVSEVGLMMFIGGGLLLMVLVALTVGVATGQRLFFAYSIYAIAKIGMWWTMVGLTHQFLITKDFHWSYMSINGALVIASGIWFSRIFLQSRRYTPKLDYGLLLMMWLAFALVMAAMVHWEGLAVILITILLLMYPLICLGGILRWRQGANEAGVFAIAWGFLAAGLLAQALRDLGFVDHNLINYYWPVVGSFTEMMVIMIAMGMNLANLRRQKDDAEYRYLVQLENRKSELESLVKERTRELEKAKSAAEVEARTDPLTGANNRRSFYRLGASLLRRSIHRDAPFSLLMFDLDHFKAINDTYGHGAGDQALKLFASTLKEEIRETDIFGRIGGEEFALLVAGSDDSVVQTAERLRKKVEQLRLVVDDQEITFTSSVGVAHYGGETTIDDLICRADAALYQAKQSGRNRVVVAADAEGKSLSSVPG